MNSVIGLLDLLENLARMSITESLFFCREISKTMRISLSETVRVEEVGRESSGRADVKFQSSSADAPLDGFGGCAWAGAEKSTREFDGAALD